MRQRQIDNQIPNKRLFLPYWGKFTAWKSIIKMEANKSIYVVY